MIILYLMEIYIDYIVFDGDMHWLYCIWWRHTLIILYLSETYIDYIVFDGDMHWLYCIWWRHTWIIYSVTNAVSSIELKICSAQQRSIFQYTPGNKYILIVNDGCDSSITSQWQWTLFQRQRPLWTVCIASSHTKYITS